MGTFSLDTRYENEVAVLTQNDQINPQCKLFLLKDEEPFSQEEEVAAFI